VTIERSTRPVAAKRIVAVARELLDASRLCAIASVSRRHGAHINTAYFAWAADFRCVWLSHPAAGHSSNIRANPSVAIAVYDSTQTWGNPDRGIQLFGTARELSGRAEQSALEVYVERFPEYSRDELGAYRLYALRPRRMKLFDEQVLGAGAFVMARVGERGDVTWERTERYRPSG
jgi:uncharacterized protein YhbP (UPF0306 family)